MNLDMGGGVLSPAEEQVLARAVDAAPSVLNTRPWRLHVDGDVVDLHADPARRLEVMDPRGREQTISCGAALMNLRLAAAHLGREPVVESFPDPEDPTLLARVRLDREHRPTREEERLYAAIPTRHTDRRPFREERLPAQTVALLEDAASAEGGILRILIREELPAMLQVARAAQERYRADPALRAELARWVGGTRGREYGIPAFELGPRSGDPLAPVRDFDPSGGIPRGEADFEREPNLALLSTFYDEPADWLRAGQAMQRVLLLATDLGLSTSLLTHPLELADLRQWVRDPSLITGHPQVILRLGYPR
ncbi:hypothetical protein C3Y87_16020 [Carbonactinospora thermoautotrophica]|uniref:Acg family FMN-binding oxidoreductase n=1 Tax=Carbonactinospora thermoautotrophica TaxID=1469144 RepID=UPI002271DE23|nr:nitroreductase [Carbonactinospora thermoautotrophica]MCX9192894.1 hypothetical protein [Carbonactinospora thermoautotrophica]